MSQDLRAPIRRELSPAERNLLEWVIKHSAQDPERYLSQIPQLRVVGRCACGCPTVDLALKDHPYPRDTVAQLMAEADGPSPEGIPVGVLVFATAGVLSELEVYSVTGDTPISLPVLSTLSPAPPEQHG